jgi:hypothetical protein
VTKLACLLADLAPTRGAGKRKKREGRSRKKEMEFYLCWPLELELELIQTHMMQKPLLWVEVGKSACGDLRIAPLSACSI